MVNDLYIVTKAYLTFRLWNEAMHAQNVALPTSCDNLLKSRAAGLQQFFNPLNEFLPLLIHQSLELSKGQDIFN